MKFFVLLPLALGFSLSAASISWAQDRTYRCPTNHGVTEYTNTLSPAQAQAKHCTLFSGGNVSVLNQGRKASGNLRTVSAGSTAAATSPASAPRIDAADQRAKDSDSRTILASELRKAEAHLAELQKTYNNGAPEKLASEAANPQKYQERVTELKAAIGRDESDIVSIRRELSRLP